MNVEKTVKAGTDSPGSKERRSVLDPKLAQRHEAPENHLFIGKRVQMIQFGVLFT